MAGPYNARWQKARLGHLRSHPLCAYCLKQGRPVSAQVVDHIKPHKGDTRLFWDKANWQSLCFNCHNATKQSEERIEAQGIGCDVDGLPRDPNHFWRTGG